MTPADKLADYLMRRGCLKNAWAERRAREIIKLLNHDEAVEIILAIPLYLLRADEHRELFERIEKFKANL